MKQKEYDDRAKVYSMLMEAAAAYIAEERPKMQGPADIATFMRPLLQGEQQERFFVLLLNTKHYLISTQPVTTGIVDAALVHAREIFRTAIQQNSSKILVCHNHPSGDPTPSAQDISLTRNLVAAGKIIGIEVLDHIVIGVRTPTRVCDYISFREQNLL